MSQPASSAPRRRRGQPVVMLALLLVGWGSLRFATWASPLPPDYVPEAEVPAVAVVPVDRRRNAARLAAPAVQQAAPGTGAPVAPLPPAALPGGWSDPTAAHRQIVPPQVSAAPVDAASGEAPQPAPRMVAGHVLLMAAGFSQMEVPPQVAAYFNAALAAAPRGGEAANRGMAMLTGAPSVPAATPQDTALASNSGRTSRWSADGWLMWRDDTTTAFTSGYPSYGRSQAGAVVRYRLAPQSGHAPQAYLRGSLALQGAREREAALGLSARPLAGLPVRLAGEVRMGDRSAGSDIRPAVYAVTELAPQRLPGGATAEAYVQAGYVGGDAATAFVDGQARVDRTLASAGDFDLRAGAAAWGGAQDGGGRLDIGPSASLTFRLGETRARVAADYRVRVAGQAQPSSGPALTLSAGF